MLINWCRLEIEPLDPNTPTDTLAGRGAIRRRYLATVIVRAQLDWQSTETRERSVQTGAAPMSRAIATIRERDAAAVGYTPKLGDIIRRQINRDGTVIDTDLYVREANRRGQWPSRYSTWVIRLTDEAPARKVS